MSSLVLGVLAVIVGAVFCFRGAAAMRLVLALWGAFAGLNVGGAAVAAVTGEGYLATAAGWIVGAVVAAVFAALAYLYYAVAIVLVMASVGFALGLGAAGAVGVEADWVAVVIGVVAGLALAWLAVAVDLPSLILVAVSVLGGALVTVAGILLLVGRVDTAELRAGELSAHLTGWWYGLYLVLLIAGAVVQLRGLRTGCSMRTQWDGGRPDRAATLNR